MTTNCSSFPTVNTKMDGLQQSCPKTDMVYLMAVNISLHSSEKITKNGRKTKWEKHVIFDYKGEGCTFIRKWDI